VSDLKQFEDRVRQALVTAVRDEPVPSLPSGPAYRARAGHRMSWGLSAAAVAAAVVLLVGVLVVAGRGASGVPQPQGGPAAWPARGSLAGDAALTGAAIRTWEAALLPPRELPHRDVTVLYAERTIAGDVVVLTGVDALGHRRIAEFDTDATSTTVFRHRLHLVADLLAPTGHAAGLVAIAAPRHTPRKTDDDLLVAIAAPGTRVLEWRDDVTHWAKLPVVDGAASLVHVGSVNDTFVRAGTDGDGIVTMGRFFPMGPPAGQAIVHDFDPGEQPPAGPGDVHESCNGNECSATAGPFPMSVSAGKNAWTNLLDSGVTTGHDWWEYGGEVGLYTDTFLPNDSNSSGPTWSGILADKTGIFLEFYRLGSGPTHLIAYVDRPEWSGGSVIDVVPRSGALPALAVDVATPRGRALDVVVVDGVTPQWSTGSGPWHSLAVHDHVGSAVVPAAAGGLHWRAVDASGAVVAAGVPHVVSPR
jgi:hypothetical protein